jgi:hypothetical protein
MRLRAERGNVAQADDALNPVRGDLGQHRLERRQIPMNIRENGNLLHGASLLLSAPACFGLSRPLTDERPLSSVW